VSMRRVVRFARRFARWTLTGVVLSVLVVAASVWYLGRRGSGALELWVSDQIQLVAADYLNPKLTFDDLDYEFPATIRLKNLRLTAVDPDHPGKTIDILGAGRAEVELAEIPQVGQPVHIASVVLREPMFQAVSISGTHRLIGFSDLLKTLPTPAPKNSAPMPGPKPTPPLAPVMPIAAAKRLSDFIRMRRIELVGGRIVYDSRVEGTPAMTLDHIDSSLIIEPTADGWYCIHTKIERKPIIELAVAGQFNLDNFTAADVLVTLKAQLGREHDGYLPPDLQTLLKQYDVRGSLVAKMTGSVPVYNYRAGHLDLNATLTNANVTFGDVRVPVEKMKLNGTLADNRLVLSSLTVQALRGDARINGSVALNESLDAQLGVTVRDMLLDETIRPGSAATTQPKYGGRMNADIVAAAPLKSIARSFRGDALGDGDAELPEQWGKGKLDLREARLMYTPLVQDLNDAIGKGQSLFTGEKAPTSQPNDRAKIVFVLSGDGARCSEILYEGGMFAARGQGTIGLDRRLNLTMNAGPLEKMQVMMGGVGRAFGKLTDQVAAYRVTGAIGEPQVDVEVAGGQTVKRMGRGVRDGFEGLAGAGGG
jgi:hypothetical protein